jgi:alpha-aminoadipate/glutamate carrier protein LysW
VNRIDRLWPNAVTSQSPFPGDIFQRGIKTVPLAACPECEAEIHVDEDVDKGEIIYCEECESSLEVVGLDPIELDLSAGGDDDPSGDDDDDY